MFIYIYIYGEYLYFYHVKMYLKMRSTAFYPFLRACSFDQRKKRVKIWQFSERKNNIVCFCSIHILFG